jgi:transposase
VAVEAHGTLLAATLTGANANDVTQRLPLIGAIPPVGGKPGATKRRPLCVLADRGYDHDRYRTALACRDISTRIARRGTPHGSGLGVWRYVVEQTLALLHQFRRLRTRFDNRDDIHEAFLASGCGIICWRLNYGLL